jgi:hypothetical protein
MSLFDLALPLHRNFAEYFREMLTKLLAHHFPSVFGDE